MSNRGASRRSKTNDGSERRMRSLKAPSGRSGTQANTIIHGLSSSNRDDWRSVDRNISALSDLLRFDETTLRPPLAGWLDIAPVLRNQFSFNRYVAYLRQIPLRNPVRFVNSHVARLFVLQFTAHEECPPIQSGGYAGKRMEKHVGATVARRFPASALRRDRILVKLQRLAFGIRLDKLDLVNPCRNDMTGAVVTRVCCDEQSRSYQRHTLACRRKRCIHLGMHGPTKLKKTTDPGSTKFLHRSLFVDVLGNIQRFQRLDQFSDDVVLLPSVPTISMIGIFKKCAAGVVGVGIGRFTINPAAGFGHFVRTGRCDIAILVNECRSHPA